MFSSARIGWPAATCPTSGSPGRTRLRTFSATLSTGPPTAPRTRASSSTARGLGGPRRRGRGGGGAGPPGGRGRGAGGEPLEVLDVGVRGRRRRQADGLADVPDG